MRRATFGVRAAAYLIDMLIVGLVWSAVDEIRGMFFDPRFVFCDEGICVTQRAGADVAAIVVLVAVIVGTAFYYADAGRTGATLGKRVMKLWLLDENGRGVIGRPRALARYVVSIVSALPLGLGYLWVLWDADRQTWHDKITSSKVVVTS